MRRASGWIALFVVACSQAPDPSSDAGVGPVGPPTWVGLAGDRAPPLPPQSVGGSNHFLTAEACAQCHSAGTGVLRDTKGRDVAPLSQWRGTMMAHAARDPFYLATFSQELAHRPGATRAVESLCARCHAPGAVFDLEADGDHLSFATLTSGTGKVPELARDGVNCSLCHQIQPDGLGSFASFDGAFVIKDERRIFGPHANPQIGPMQTFVSYTPTEAPHPLQSSLCATCHTVITKALDPNGKPVGPDFVEQGAYLEWRASDFRTEGTPGPKAASCQSCHIPTSDEDGAPISSVLALYPTSGLGARSPIGRHVFVGGNSQMLRVIGDERDWVGTIAPQAALDAQVARTEKNLQAGAGVTITSAGKTQAVVRVENRTGHKFPTGYPSRRAWLHVKVTAFGQVKFESGRWDTYGRIVDANGAPIDGRDQVRLHRDVVRTSSEAQIYELVPGDSKNRPARSLLDASAVLKDDRLLPRGFYPPAGALVAPVGTADDANFGATDDVTFVYGDGSSGGRVDVELCFQSVRPSELENLAGEPTPMSRRFLDMIAKRVAPVVIATATAPIP